ncbi:MAG TPA: pilus assembly protein TadG-related protein, partial [Jatrophihabitantaceae bacterium]
MRPARPHRSNTDERGVVLIFVALTMVAILVIASIVIDLGQLRNTRRQSQSATDLASLAAGYYLSGHGNAAATSDPRGACNAALNSLRSNLSDLPAATALDCDSLPLTGSAPYCTSITSIPPLTATGASPYEVTIQYPVPASEIRDSRFAGGTGVNDGTAATSQCERMKVTVRRTNGAIFSGIMGIASSSTGASSVVRSTTGPNPDRVAALLLLERVGCSVLSQGGGGSQGGGVLVESSGASKPGVIQADSAGVVGATVGGFGSYQPCTTNENATGYVVYGTALPVAGGGGTSITAKASSDGSPGIIGIYGLAIGGRGGAVSNTGISPAATAALPMSRVGADNKYNGDPLNGGSEQITTFHASAYALTTGAAPSGYRVLSGSACNGLNTSSTPVTEQYVYVNCADFSPDTAVFPNATHVIFTGKISVANNKLLSLPAAREIDVRGCTSGCSGGGNY